MNECPTCGREDFKSEKGIKVHHKRTHGESLLEESSVCENCGENFTYNTRHSDGVYCSKKCFEEKDGSIVDCVYCGESKYVYPCNEGKEYYYCDYNCLSNYIETLDGDEAPNWQGGLSNTDDFTSSAEGIAWRNSVFERDNYTCQDCGQTGGCLNSHHIKQRKDYPEVETDVDNGVTLCYECHADRHEEKGQYNIANLIRASHE